ncbi:MAG: PocR ligand-binding domain-containing protein, partial [Candidatus Lokiarchaeota archaeon]
MNSNSDIKIKRQYKYLKKLLSDDYEITSEEFSFIINSLEIQSLLDNFHKLTHIGIGILDMKGKVHVHTEWQDICTKFHRVNPQSCRNCIDSDIFLTKEIKEGKYLMYKCKNNMRSLATPIYFGEKRIGTLYFG